MARSWLKCGCGRILASTTRDDDDDETIISIATIEITIEMDDDDDGRFIDESILVIQKTPNTQICRSYDNCTLRTLLSV